MTHYEVIVIPVSKIITANLDADKVDKGKTSKTFTVGLSPTGKLPVTHYWCCWWVSDEEAIKLRKDFNPLDPMNPTNKNSSYMYDLSKDVVPNRILEELHLRTTQSEIIKEKEKETKGVK